MDSGPVDIRSSLETPRSYEYSTANCVELLCCVIAVIDGIRYRYVPKYIAFFGQLRTFFGNEARPRERSDRGRFLPSGKKASS